MFSLTQVSLHNCFLEHQVIHLLADSLTEEGKLKLHLHTTGRTAGPDLTYRGIKRSGTGTYNLKLPWSSESATHRASPNHLDPSGHWSTKCQHELGI